jgi:hypothetical protein
VVERRQEERRGHPRRATGQSVPPATAAVSPRAR